MLNELFNEFAYNPGSKQGGFLFFLDWANHDFNSAVSTADAHGPLGQTLAYFNCNVVPILKGAGEVNPTVRLLLGLLNPPTGAACSSATAVKASAARGPNGSASSTGLLGGARRRRVRPAGHDAPTRPSATGLQRGRATERCRSARPRWATSW